jgi:hypothetical protein
LVRDLDYPNFFQKSPPMNIDWLMTWHLQYLFLKSNIFH